MVINPNQQGYWKKEKYFWKCLKCMCLHGHGSLSCSWICLTRFGPTPLRAYASRAHRRWQRGCPASWQRRCWCVHLVPSHSAPHLATSMSGSWSCIEVSRQLLGSLPPPSSWPDLPWMPPLSLSPPFVSATKVPPRSHLGFVPPSVSQDSGRSAAASWCTSPPRRQWWIYRPVEGRNLRKNGKISAMDRRL